MTPSGSGACTSLSLTGVNSKIFACDNVAVFFVVVFF